MKVFISWSGHTSHQVALALHGWLPCVLNEAKPFVSSEDIRKGNRWLVEISQELEASSFGIICLTATNLGAPWILFEAGALSKSLKESQVCTVLLGKLKPTDVKGPLAGFQHTAFNCADFKKLVAAINTQLDEKKLPDAVLTKVFEKWWPELESAVGTILNSDSSPTPEARSESDILQEILELSRSIARSIEIEPEPELEKLRMLIQYPTSEVNFSHETMKELNRLGLATIGSLITWTTNQLVAEGLSNTKINEITERLATMGLSLGMTFDKKLLVARRRYRRA